jgi:mRNA interferase MazF
MGVMGKQKNYVPDRGDLVWLDCNPQLGHEQAGVRPALVISPASYNKVVGLALVCPITSKIKEYPFEVKLPQSCCKIKGAVLSDQIKSLDWLARKFKFITKAPNEVLNEVIDKMQALISENI